MGTKGDWLPDKMEEYQDGEVSAKFDKCWHEKLLLICQLIGNKDAQLGVEELLSSFTEQDWADFWEISRNHSVSEHLFARIKACNLEALLPQKTLERSRQLLYESISANSWLLQTGNQVTQKLLESGIETLALKGLFLQQAVYKVDEIRPMNDIDLLVRREDIPKAIDILKKNGFRMESHFDPAFENEDIKHVPPMWNEFGQTVELHWNLLEEDEPFSIDMGQVWSQKQCFEENLWGLSVEHLIVHLAIHGTYQHYLRLGLRSLLDLSRVIERYADSIQWGLVVETARAWKAEKSLWISLKLAEKYLSVALPEDAMLSIEPKNGAEMLIRASLLTETLRPGQTVLSPDLIELSKEKDFASRSKRILKRIFIPKIQLARLYNIDPKSLGIYPAYIRRIMDLLKQYRKTYKKIDTQSDEISNEVNVYEEQIALHKWFGLND